MVIDVQFVQMSLSMRVRCTLSNLYSICYSLELSVIACVHPVIDICGPNRSVIIRNVLSFEGYEFELPVCRPVDLLIFQQRFSCEYTKKLLP